jgi:nucleoside 2-deoxyribosyltransferase
MSEKLIYLASPYTSHKKSACNRNTEQYLRFTEVCEIAAKLLKKGVLVLSPIAHSHPIAMSGGAATDWAAWQRLCLRLIDACDEVWVVEMPGWTKSKGIKAEVKYAKEHGKPVSFIDPKTFCRLTFE